MEWGKRIATARARQGLTQAGLAEIIHVSQTTLAKWELEKRQPKLEDIERIALATRTTPEWLAFGVGEGPVSED